jgi:hypothetical protein
MDINSRECGLFTKKIYIGQFFAEKTFEEFLAESRAKEYKVTADEVRACADKYDVSIADAREMLIDSKAERDAQKAYDKYMEDERIKEYVIMREASTTESRSVQVNDVDDKVLARLPPEAQVERAERIVKQREEKENEVIDLVAKCIVGSSFVDNGKPADLDTVREIIKGSTFAMAYLVGEWMGSSGSFPRKSGRN